METLIFDTNPGNTVIKKSHEPYELVVETDPILHKKMPQFDFNGDVNIKEIVNRMKATAMLHRALGLAAPQVGLEYNLFIMGAEQEYFPCINPTYEILGNESILMKEFCLSFPFLELNISRPEKIKATYQDENGKVITRIFSGISSRTFQHEFEHTLGITFQQKTKPIALKNGLKKREKRMKQFARELVRNNIMRDQQKVIHSKNPSGFDYKTFCEEDYKNLMNYIKSNGYNEVMYEKSP